MWCAGNLLTNIHIICTCISTYGYGYGCNYFLNETTSRYIILLTNLFHRLSVSTKCVSVIGAIYMYRYEFLRKLISARYYHCERDYMT